MRPPVLTLALVLLVAPSDLTQKPIPPGVRQADATEDQTQKNIPPPAQATARVDTEKLGRQAEELARIAQTIPADVANLQKGLLAQGVVEKLRRIEKLSKSMRSVIGQ